MSQLPIESARPSYQFASWLARLFIVAPFALLLYICTTWLSLAIDLPYYDDWSVYITNNIGSLSPSYLFTSANDTLYPVGKILDSLAYYAFKGNTIAYQLVSMGFVLGACLWLQFRLLQSVIVDRFILACCFAITLLMLRSGTYWGGPNLAYHQALPIVCLLASLYLIVCEQFHLYFKLVLIFLLGLLAGLSYISGAFSFLGAGLVICVIALNNTKRTTYLLLGGALGGAGLITSAMQAYVLIVIQRGETHRIDAPWASPLTVDFWLYLLGIVSRSLGLPRNSPEISIAITSLLIMVIAVIVANYLYLLLRHVDVNKLEYNRMIVTLSLFIVVFVYLLLVSVGRANFGKTSIGEPLNAFSHGYWRFYFFWVTVIWPWVFYAVLFLFSKRLSWKIIRPIAGAITIGFISLQFVFGNFSHNSSFGYAEQRQFNGLTCLQRELISSESIYCDNVYPDRELTAAYFNAVVAGMSFVRYAPPSLRFYNPSKHYDIFDFSRPSPGTFSVKNGEIKEQGDTYVMVDADDDFGITITSGRVERMRDCQALMLRASVSGPEGEIAELFYIPAGGDSFSKRYRGGVQLDSKTPTEIVVLSRNGFEDRIRFDPVRAPGQVRVAKLKVRCLIFRTGAQS